MNFFFKRIQRNKSNRFTDWPFVSPCGKEINYIRCKDSPIVFHSFAEEKNEEEGDFFLLFGFSLKFPFDPSSLLLSQEGKLYHPSPLGNALLRSHLVIEFRDLIQIQEDKPFFDFKGKRYPINPINP